MKTISEEIKTLEPINTIAVSHKGEYSGICGAFEKLCTWATANNLWNASPKMAAVYHDDPSTTATEDLRSDACLENLSNIDLGEGMHPYTISGGKYFVTQVEVLMSEYTEAWQKAYTTFNEKGYAYDDRDHHERYISCKGDNHDPNAAWVVDLCIPMK